MVNTGLEDWLFLQDFSSEAQLALGAKSIVLFSKIILKNETVLITWKLHRKLIYLLLHCLFASINKNCFSQAFDFQDGVNYAIFAES